MKLSKATPITLNDKPLFDDYFERYPPRASEFSFTNFFIWRKYYNLHFLEWDNHLVLFSRDFLKKWKDPQTQSDEVKTFLSFFPPIGGSPAEVILNIYEELSDQNTLVEFHRVPKYIQEDLQKLSGFSELNLAIVDDRANWDYVYDRDELYNLSGNKYRSKRRLLEKFKDQYKYEFQLVTNDSVDLIDKCRELQNKWCVINECQKNEDLQEEQRAINELFDNFTELDVKGGLILVKDEPAGYTFGEKINEDTMVIHLEKAHTYYEGAYQAINNMFIEHCCLDGIKYVNREQDLGIPGLRKAKKSYHPEHMIQKGIVYRKVEPNGA